MRPTLAEIKRQVVETTMRQVQTNVAGMMLAHTQPAAMEQLIRAITNNVAQVVGGMFDECCGEEP